MLQDFLLLEQHFGRAEARLDLQKLIAEYSLPNVSKAVSEGDLSMKRVICDKYKNTCLFWLSEQGRKKAALEKETTPPR